MKNINFQIHVLLVRVFLIKRKEIHNFIWLYESKKLMHLLRTPAAKHNIRFCSFRVRFGDCLNILCMSTYSSFCNRNERIYELGCFWLNGWHNLYSSWAQASYNWQHRCWTILAQVMANIFLKKMQLKMSQWQPFFSGIGKTGIRSHFSA